MFQPAPGRLPYDLDKIIRNTPPVSGVFALYSLTHRIRLPVAERNGATHKSVPNTVRAALPNPLR
jgi:hypothetical protein